MRKGIAEGILYHLKQYHLLYQIISMQELIKDRSGATQKELDSLIEMHQSLHRHHPVMVPHSHYWK